VDSGPWTVDRSQQQQERRGRHRGTRVTRDVQAPYMGLGSRK
jgi:hypothetical protein